MLLTVLNPVHGLKVDTIHRICRTSGQVGVIPRAVKKIHETIHNIWRRHKLVNYWILCIKRFFQRGEGTSKFFGCCTSTIHSMLQVDKVVMFERGQVVHALVQFTDVAAALTARWAYSFSTSFIERSMAMLFQPCSQERVSVNLEQLTIILNTQCRILRYRIV